MLQTVYESLAWAQTLTQHSVWQVQACMNILNAPRAAAADLLGLPAGVYACSRSSPPTHACDRHPLAARVRARRKTVQCPPVRRRSVARVERMGVGSCAARGRPAI